MLLKSATKPLRPLLGPLWQRLHHVGSVAMWVSGTKTLKEMGFHPKTVFDIGVAAGTPDLYNAFPDAYFFLVDPTEGSLPHMRRIAGELDAEICSFAVGDVEGEIDIEERLDDINGASLFRDVGPLGETRRYSVPIRRFDAAFPDFAPPALCKIDVQGAELMVLRGMGERIADLDVLIVEVSVLSTVDGGPEAWEIIGFLREKGFVIFDIVGMARRPLDNALGTVDLLFIKEDSPLRSDRRWRAAWPEDGAIR
ncbi:FkbM family methyltransferase [Parvibaculum sp.]|uniref:FkbM family methyltransferase n=1 Tax=Parvibaculum sp. TaxID=2024848 RepID=UPI002C1A5697|nr:FkbM family methyltransferase [Parvibaculum sp.]HUD52235.1 FkbM family methyltransferase [Parvibaculum sp.]